MDMDDKFKKADTHLFIFKCERFIDMDKSSVIQVWMCCG